MKTNSYLIAVTSEDLLKLKVKNINFLFPMTGYSVGFYHTFTFEEISVPHSYIFINRILDKETISNLKRDLANLPETIAGICFTDLGILHIVKELNLSVQLIYMQNHNTTNRLSIEYYLEYVDSVLLSTDITEEEMRLILDNVKKPLVVPYFMRADAMYSRRTLLTNYADHFGYPKKTMETLQEEITDQSFFAVENEYGTVLYADKFIDYHEFSHENILYYYINPLGLTNSEIEAILNGEEILNTDTGFLHKETYYRLKEEEECL